MSMKKLSKKMLAVVAAGAMTWDWQCRYLQLMEQQH